MQNETFLRPLNYAPGDGTLHYYLYNWKTALLRPDQVGVAML
jgi:glycylpeptide N-tetradecanoyltransferase